MINFARLTRVSECLVEPGEEKGPLVLGVAHYILLHLQDWGLVFDVVTLETIKRVFVNVKFRPILPKPLSMLYGNG